MECPHYQYVEFHYNGRFPQRVPICVGQKYSPKVSCGGDRESPLCPYNKTVEKPSHTAPAPKTWYDKIHEASIEDLARFLEIVCEGARSSEVEYTYDAILETLKEEAV